MHSATVRDATYKFASLATVLDLHTRLPALVDDLEGPVLHIALDLRFVHLATDKTLSVEDGVFGVGMKSVLGAITDTTRGR